MTKEKPVYGIWNSVLKRFVLGIREPSKEAALRVFRKKASWKMQRMWRYEVRKWPSGFKNPQNPHYNYTE